MNDHNNLFDHVARKTIAANDRVRQVERIERLLADYKKHTLGGLTSKSSRFWEEVATYQLAGALSKLFGCDSFEDMEEMAADELRREHSYDIREEMDLDSDGFPKSPYRVTSGMGG